MTRILPFEEGWIERIADADRADRLVILLVDPWAVQVERMRALLQEYDRHTFRNCALLLLWNDKDEETRAAWERLEEGVRAVFPHKTQSRDSLFRTVRAAAELESEFRNVLAQLRRRVLHTAKLTRAT